VLAGLVCSCGATEPSETVAEGGKSAGHSPAKVNTAGMRATDENAGAGGLDPTAGVDPGGQPHAGERPQVCDPGVGLRRPIRGQVAYDTGGPAPNVTVLVACEEFVSDADGWLDATAPATYQAIVLDPGEFENHERITIWEGLTRHDPVFTIQGDYHAAATAITPGQKHDSTGVVLSGDYPADAGRAAAFWSDTTIGSDGPTLPDDDYISVSVRYQGPAPSGHLVGLAWAKDSANRPTAYWYAATPFDWADPNRTTPTPLPLEAIEAQPLDLHIETHSAISATLTLDWNGFWPIDIEDAPGPSVSGRYFLPAVEVPRTDPQWLEVRCNYEPGGGVVRATVPPDAKSFSAACPAPPIVLEPPKDATGVQRGSAFEFTAPSGGCHTLWMGSGRYSVYIHTQAERVVPPDLEPFGMPWPADAKMIWGVGTHACDSLDESNRDSTPSWDTWWSGVGSAQLTTAAE
jgi:hypothetical protein